MKSNTHKTTRASGGLQAACEVWGAPRPREGGGAAGRENALYGADRCIPLEIAPGQACTRQGSVTLTMAF